MRVHHVAPLELTPPLPVKALLCCADGATGCMFLGTFACDGPCRLMAHTPEILPRQDEAA